MLISYGWTENRQHDFDSDHPTLAPARVVEQQRGAFRVVTNNGERSAQISGRLAFDAEQGGLPAVGDWVAITPVDDDAATIHHVLPRSSVFQRRAPGGRLQTICANLDLALLVVALNGDFNPRRLERYLAVARNGAAAPVIVLTKADLCADVEARRSEIDAIAGGAPIVAVSALNGEGLAALNAHLTPGKTAALLGSSGAGKSTLLNALAADTLMHTSAISGDNKRGLHTTTHRELFLLPSGALMLDSPGMRELSVAEADAGVSATFEDVETLMASCRFSDCSHDGEPGCAVQAALDDDTLDPARWASYQKLQRELAFEVRKDDVAARAAHKEVWMKRHKDYRALQKFRKQRDDD
jgi:ribosome biogenesis GTPase